MNLKATLTPVQNLRAVQNIGGNGGSGSTTWDKVKDKPFETLGEDFVVEDGVLGLGAVPVGSVDWDNIEDKPNFSTVATTGDYNDLSNTPTIPVADGTTIIDNNGVWSAVGSTPTLEIDNQSLVVDSETGKIREAVPVWTETVQSETTELTTPANRRTERKYLETSQSEQLANIVSNYNPINSITIFLYYTESYAEQPPIEIATINNVDLTDSTTVYSAGGYHWKVYYLNDKLCIDSSDYYFVNQEPEQSVYGYFYTISYDYSTATYNNILTWDSINEPTNEYRGSLNGFQNGQRNPDLKFTYYVNNNSYYLEANDFDYQSSTDQYFTDTNGLRWLVKIGYIQNDDEYWYASFKYEDGILPVNINNSGLLEATIYTTSYHQVVHQLPAQYVPIDNETIINDQGILKAVGGGSNVSVNQILSSGTAIADITVDGATTTLYAPSGGSVNIDNKSLVEVSGVIQEAVPIYTERVFVGAYEGLYFDTFSYPSGIDLDCYLYTNNNPITLITSSTAYDIVISIDGTVYTGTWNAGYSASPTDYYGGYGSFDIPDLGSGYELYWSYEELDGGAYGYRIHIYMNGAYIDNGNVDFLMFAPTDQSDTLESQLTSLGLSSMWQEYSVYETVNHKLPKQYYDSVVVSNDTYSVVDRNNKARIIGNGEGIGLELWGSYNGTAFEAIGVKVRADGRGITTDKNDCVASLFGNAFNNSLSGSYGIGGITWHSSANLFDCGDCDWLVVDNLPLIFPIFDSVILLANDGQGYTPKGYEALFDRIEVIVNASSAVSYNGRYYSDGQNVVQFIGPKFDTSGYNDGQYIQIKFTALNGRNSDYVKLNHEFIPVDNTTIKTNSDGQLETAIPAPPSADDTYTLQAVVTNGEVHYYWLGTPQ